MFIGPACHVTSPLCIAVSIAFISSLVGQYSLTSFRMKLVGQFKYISSSHGCVV